MRFTFLAIASLAILAPPARTLSQSASGLTAPRQHFGAEIGDDYFLVTYTQLEDYWKTLDRESARMQLVDIGRTAEGRTQWMAVLSAPENLVRLERFRDISRRLSLAEDLTDAQARALAAEGKAVVFISGGIHATEVLGSHQLIELVHRLASASDPETLRILRDVIVLAVDANPDGHELAAGWYMRHREPSRRTLDDLPRAYQKYVGHDNNRDFFMATQAETININRVLYRQWFPQIVYDHHQAGPAGTVMFAPPFRGPVNYVFDPLLPPAIDLIGGAMHARFAAEGKRGVTMRSGATYSTWWNGGLRTTAYFHNQIGLLTETIGSPTPMTIPTVADRLLPSADLPLPIAPQRWHFRQSLDYSMTANLAVLDAASRFRETLLFNVYRMGKNSIERGSQDTWTASPKRMAAVARRDPAARDPRAYVLPSDQPDFLTATKFVDALLENGITVHRADARFAAGDRTYPAGSYVVKTAQAFRPHVLDMFEPQDHPDDIPYPGAMPTPPYDNAGWTLAFQMGIKFDRLLDAVPGRFEPVTAAAPPKGTVASGDRVAGYLLPHAQNDAFIAVNRLLRAGADVYWPTQRGGRLQPDRDSRFMYVPASPASRMVALRSARDLGLTFLGATVPPAGKALRLRPVRIGLWDRYGGASSSGWVRWLLERYEFPFEVVYAQQLDEGDLADKFDVLIFTDEAVPSNRPAVTPRDLSVEYRHTTGAITRERTIPQLESFVESGGTLITIGNSTRIAEAFDLGVAPSHARSLPREQFYIPGSVLRLRVDNEMPLAYGFEREVDVVFDSSPTFRMTGGSSTQDPPHTQRVAWFDTPAPLRSGWAWGQHHLDGAVAVVDAPLGRGRVLMFGPEITFRAQAHGTFKFLFNGILYGKAEVVSAVTRRRVAQ